MTLAAAPGQPALAPLEAALAVVRRRRGPSGTAGLLPGLIAPASADMSRTGEGRGTASDWLPATDLVSGVRLDEVLLAAARRWHADRHVAAALAWRSYTYWLAMPVVLGYATARRLPLLHPADVSVRLNEHNPFLTISLSRVRLAILPDDPLATVPASGAPDAVVVDNDEHLLRLLRQTLRTDHLDPLLAQIQARVRLGERNLFGSLASAVGYAAVRGLDAPPERVIRVATEILSALEIADLVTIDPPDGTAPGGVAEPPVLRRRTCCLAFTLPEPKICSGCCLRR